jgi:uncharacterized protein DUF4112
VAFPVIEPKPLEPEVLPPAPEWIDRLAWLMDRSIPIGRWKIGLDGIIGLVPGLGDLAGAVISGVIVAAGIRAGLPRSAIARMVTNVGVEALIGVVPFLGDLFDMAFKANTRNVQIYREALRGRRNRSKDSLFVAGVVVAFAALLAVPILVIVLLLQRLLF